MQNQLVHLRTATFMMSSTACFYIMSGSLHGVYRKPQKGAQRLLFGPQNGSYGRF